MSFLSKLWGNVGLHSHCVPGVDGSWHRILGYDLPLLHQTGASSIEQTFYVTHGNFTQTLCKCSLFATSRFVFLSLFLPAAVLCDSLPFRPFHSHAGNVWVMLPSNSGF